MGTGLELICQLAEPNGSSESESSLFDDKKKKKKNDSAGSRKQLNRTEEDAKMQVGHGRARRRQAADGHSLAEKVRRGKINGKMQRLQDLVPGCYKAMGTKGMLKQTIKYVQSLQNQVDYLSSRLAAAASYGDSLELMNAVARQEEHNVYLEEELAEERDIIDDGGFSFPSTVPF